jgi:DNA replication protein DnaC
VLASKVTSAAAATLLRCASCMSQGHLALGVKAGTVPTPTKKRPAPPVAVRTLNVRSEEDRELDRMAAREAHAMRRAEAKARWDASLPEKFRRPLDDVQERAVQDRLERLRTGRGSHQTSLLTYGPYGSGKTWVGYSYARLAVEKNLLWPSEIVHGTEAEIMEPLAFASRWEMADRLKKFLNPRMKMLMIDDVGNMGRWPDVDTRHATYASVINWMWENNRALILTTNQRPGEGGELSQWIGTAAYERLRNMVGKDVVLRVGDKRAALTAQWEREYQENLANADA